jgi:hypothetical protein
VIHNYRWRIGLAEGERQYDNLEKRFAGTPSVSVPAITLEGNSNGAPHRAQHPIAVDSQANMHTGSSAAASDTICLKKLRKLLPKL